MKKVRKRLLALLFAAVTAAGSTGYAAFGQDAQAGSVKAADLTGETGSGSGETSAGVQASSPSGGETSADVQAVSPVGGLADKTPPEQMEKLSDGDVRTLNEKMQGYQAESASPLRNDAPDFYYYSQLPPLCRQLYDVMLEIAQDPTTTDHIGLLMTDSDPQTEDFYLKFYLSWCALCYDHPELFWMYSTSTSSSDCPFKFGSDAVVMNGLYFVYIQLTEAYSTFSESVSAFNRAADEFLADIDTGGSEYETVCQIHDKLVQTVTYDYDGMESGNLSHTAYGALVSDSAGNAHYAVCDGYSLAFAYLCQQCGIEATVVPGLGGSLTDDSINGVKVNGDYFDMGGHAWSMVRIDGEWYETDATWDDFDTEEWEETVESYFSPGDEEYGFYMGILSDPDYMDRLTHFLFLVSTDNIRCWKPGAADYYRGSFCMLGESSHLRFCEYREMSGGRFNSIDCDISEMLPDASRDYS